MSCTPHCRSWPPPILPKNTPYIFIECWIPPRPANYPNALPAAPSPAWSGGTVNPSLNANPYPFYQPERKLYDIGLSSPAVEPAEPRFVSAFLAALDQR